MNDTVCDVILLEAKEVKLFLSMNVLNILRVPLVYNYRFLRDNGQTSCSDGYLHALYDCRPFRFRSDKSNQLCDGDLLISNK